MDASATLRQFESWDKATQGDPTMETNLILKNLDNGTITKDAAIDLMLQHTPHAYLVGAYLCAREQRDDLRQKLYALQDAQERPVMDGLVIADLIDHALETDHVDDTKAFKLLLQAGMHDNTALHHVQTILAIKDRDLERVAYLDNPDLAPRWCTRCGRKVRAAELSNRAICVECSTAAVEECLIALDTKTGPVYRRWRDAMLSFAYTLEDQAIKERHPIDSGNETMPCPMCGFTLSVDDVHCGNCDTGIYNWEREMRRAKQGTTAGTLGDYIEQDDVPACFGNGCDDPECKYENACLLDDIDPDTGIA